MELSFIVTPQTFKTLFFGKVLLRLFTKYFQYQAYILIKDLVIVFNVACFIKDQIDINTSIDKCYFWVNVSRKRPVPTVWKGLAGRRSNLLKFSGVCLHCYRWMITWNPKWTTDETHWKGAERDPRLPLIIISGMVIGTEGFQFSRNIYK